MENEKNEQALESNQSQSQKSAESDGGLLMPILYALLAGVGGFTLVMMIGIGITFRGGLSKPAVDLPPQNNIQTSISSQPSAQTQDPEATQVFEPEEPGILGEGQDDESLLVQSQDQEPASEQNDVSATPEQAQGAERSESAEGGTTGNSLPQTSAQTQSSGGNQNSNSGATRTEGVPASARSLPGSTTVYVSNNANKIHSISDCSGMKNYREMTLDEANSHNYDYCSNCW